MPNFIRTNSGYLVNVDHITYIGVEARVHTTDDARFDNDTASQTDVLLAIRKAVKTGKVVKVKPGMAGGK